MVDVTEPTRIEDKLDRQWKLLAESDIDDRDKEAIQRFINWRGDIEDVTRNTRRLDLSCPRHSSKRAHCSLVDMSLEDVEELLGLLVRPEKRGATATIVMAAPCSPTLALRRVGRGRSRRPPHCRDRSHTGVTRLVTLECVLCNWLQTRKRV